MPQAGTVAVSPFLVRMHPNAWRISRVSSFLTTAPNAVVEPIHPKAMPVILTTAEDRRARGHKEDRAAAA